MKGRRLKTLRGKARGGHKLRRGKRGERLHFAGDEVSLGKVGRGGGSFLQIERRGTRTDDRK